MKILFLLNDAPYGSDKNYNALRTAIQLQKQDKSISIFVYLMSDAVMCALDGQKVKQGAYNIALMLTEIINAGGKVKVCTSCAETRGLSQPINGADLATLTDLTTAIVEYDRVLTY
jgi:uncharacterized protein involved in oxidation of intracellular sulfur